MRTYSYDSQNRLVAENWYDPQGEQVDALRFTYNAAGQLTSASNDAGNYTYRYDSEGRLIHETEPFGQWLKFRYSGDTVTMTDSAGGVTVSKYNASGNLVSRTLSAPGEMPIGVAMGYTASGVLTGITRTSGGVAVGGTAYSYDADGNVTGIVSFDSSGDVIDGFSYTYNADGEVTSETDTTGGKVAVAAVNGKLKAERVGATATTGATIANGDTTGYSYDASGQLLSAGSTSYSYDANGNPDNSGDVIGPNNELLSDGTWNYTYDADGNEIGKTNIATGLYWVYTYDVASRLTSATEYSAQGNQLSKVAYVYDVFGNIIERDTWTAGATSPTVLRSAYNGQQVWADLNSDNQVTTRYLYGQGVNQVLARESFAAGAAWYLTDRLGSVRDIVNNAGTVLDHIVYDAYGNVVSESDPAEGDRFKFAGMQQDAVTGLYWDRARWYDSWAGRFMSQDPTGEGAGDTDLYRYVGNSPTTAADPSGLEQIPPGYDAYYQKIRTPAEVAIADIDANKAKYIETAKNKLIEMYVLHNPSIRNDPVKYEAMAQEAEEIATNYVNGVRDYLQKNPIAAPRGTRSMFSPGPEWGGTPVCGDWEHAMREALPYAAAIPGKNQDKYKFFDIYHGHYNGGIPYQHNFTLIVPEGYKPIVAPGEDPVALIFDPWKNIRPEVFDVDKDDPTGHIPMDINPQYNQGWKAFSDGVKWYIEEYGRAQNMNPL